MSVVNCQLRRLKGGAVGLALLWAIAGLCVEAPSASTTATNGPRAHAELNPALRESGHMISTSNLLGSLHEEEEKISPKQQIEMLYKLAREQHLRKNYQQAAKNLGTVLERDAPLQMKQAALIELAVIAQEQNQLAKAQQILAQYVRKYHDDPGVPEVLLRQGLIYRQMGVTTLALAKFYAVMTSALTLKSGNLDYYQRLVLQAQTEIADTYYFDRKYEEAAPFLDRLLKLDAAELNKRAIHLKLVRCLAGLRRQSEAVAQAEDFLGRYSGTADEAEARFVLATTLKQLDRKQEALEQVFKLLKLQEEALACSSSASTNSVGWSRDDVERWSYWQQRAGNEIGNELYQERDYVNALEVYSALASLNSAPAWEFPVLYQIGLVYERLQQPQKAAEAYGRILARQKELAPDASPTLKTVSEMAKWRSDFLSWRNHADGLEPGNTSTNKAFGPIFAPPKA